MRRREGRLSVLWTMVLALLPVAAALAALGIGRIQIPPADVVKSLLAKLSGSPGLEELSEKTLWQLRMPRIILAALAGAGLSVAGCAFQSLFANPLATPDTLGVASGASFGAALGILLGFKMIGIQLTSLTMGASAVALTWLCGRGRGRGLSTVVLSGIMIGSLFSALVSLVKFAADAESQLPAITYWLMGSLSGTRKADLRFVIWPMLVGLVPLLLLRWRINLLTLSEEEAQTMGVHTGRLRLVVILCATFLTAASVSVSGMIGWIGLVIPHLCRKLVGSNCRWLYPAVMIFGAIFLLLVDNISRNLLAVEIPIGILTAFIGAPFFIFLMTRKESGI